MAVDERANIVWPVRPHNHTPDVVGHPWEPWWTRAAITWADIYLRPTMHVLEFGGGSSSVWLAKRAAEVVVVEHDQRWFAWIERIRRMCHLDNLRVLYVEDEDALAALFDYLPTANDLVIIDGMDRVTCMSVAHRLVKRDGAIMLDNAEVDGLCDLTVPDRAPLDFSNGLIVEGREHVTRLWLPKDAQ